MSKRVATQVIRGQHAIDGAGVHLRRVLGPKNIKDFDPFLMLDGFDSLDPKDYIKGFPWHPHRGIETITYLIKGKIEHADSLKNKGTIYDRECQWMTAGSGIIHQEMPKPSERMLGCQLWLNLPAKDKMTTPAYGDITQDKVTTVEEQNATNCQIFYIRCYRLAPFLFCPRASFYVSGSNILRIYCKNCNPICLLPFYL